MTPARLVLVDGSDIVAARVTIHGIEVPFHLSTSGLSVSLDLVHEFDDGVSIVVWIKRRSAASRVVSRIAPPSRRAA